MDLFQNSDIRRFGVCMALFTCALCHAAADPPPRTGSFQITFEQRSPLSAMREQTMRQQWVPPAPLEDYDLKAESFQVYVPAVDVAGTTQPADAGQSASVTASKPPFGLLVWISASDDGAPPANWLHVLDEHHLIWVGANKAGNPRHVWQRFGLALDAVHNLTQRYPIDPQRIYIAGISGGGRAASRLAMAYPEVFRGGLFICGVDYFRSLPVPGKRGMEWRARFRKPMAARFNQARRNRYVLLTGEKDVNRLEMLTTYHNGFRKDRFAHVSFFDAPGMGHETPDEVWFTKAVGALEAR